jgi:hypothetical protein
MFGVGSDTHHVGHSLQRKQRAYLLTDKTVALIRGPESSAQCND